VGKLENMIDNINRFLRNKGLPKLPAGIADIQVLFEASLRSVWSLEDKEKREAIAIEIAQAIKPYYGGKKIEDALDDITATLNAEEAAKQKSAKVESQQGEIKEIQNRMKDPDYVPTFEELLRAKQNKKS
jgi:hypothetical protein